MPTILFGAFDRHNFGDLLFPHVVAHMLAGRDVRFAGLVSRDLRQYGGHQVTAIGDAMTAPSRDRALDVVHVGGELLTCNAWEAAVMLSSSGRTAATIAEEKTWRRLGREWARTRLGVASLAPYVLPRTAFPDAAATRTFFNAVGGVDLDSRDAALRAEVLAALKLAEDVSVRDRQTQTVLHAWGIAARLEPDPAVMVASLFGEAIRRRATIGAVRAVRDAFPGGYAAVQFAAEFGDDATLDTIATQLDRIVTERGIGIALFVAGAAPWHDDVACYERLASRMRYAASVRIIASLDIRDICALIAHSRVYCGSSLHGRIVATAFALPRVSVGRSDRSPQAGKMKAYAATWEPADLAAVVDVPGMADAVAAALAGDATVRQHVARELADRYREGFALLRVRLDRR